MFKVLVILLVMVFLSVIVESKTPLGAARKLVDKIEKKKPEDKENLSQKGSSSSVFKKTEAKKIEQKTCPVMGGKISPILYYNYTKKIYVCCRECIGTIGKNPEMYLEKVQKEISTSKDKTQKICPVSDKKIKPYFYYTYRKKIYVCCVGCIGVIEKNPEMYLEKVQKEIATSKKK